MKYLVFILALLPVLGGGALAEDKVVPFPFSKAVRVGDMLYLSGEIALIPGTRTMVAGGIGPQTRQVMDNIKATLEANGSDMDHVVKCLVMLADMNEWDAMNEVYRTYFTKKFPARSAFGANGLAKGALLEIECMAEVAN